MKVKELINELNKYPKESEVSITVIVDTNKLTEENSYGENEGIYFVEARPLGVDESFDDEDCPDILAEDINYDRLSNES